MDAFKLTSSDEFDPPAQESDQPPGAAHADPDNQSSGDWVLVEQGKTLTVVLAAPEMSSLYRAEERTPGASLQAMSPPIVGAYRLQEEIGRGGMGVIYRAASNDLGREVAVKILHEAHHGKPAMARRFVDEAKFTAQLQHPGVVPVYSLGQLPDGRPYFAMKLVHGRTLDDLLNARGAADRDLPRFLKIFDQVCQTIAYVHTRGVIHRDLKPGNIMVGSFGEVQVMDWGLAKALGEAEEPASAGGQEQEWRRAGEQEKESLAPGASGSSSFPLPDSCSPALLDDPTAVIESDALWGGPAAACCEGVRLPHSQIGSILGTIAFMPPEQARGLIHQLDERADVFALGAILCAILTGKPPYVAPRGWSIYRKAVRGDLAEAFARLDACGADAALIDLARDCLAGDRDARPRNATEVGRRLTAYLDFVLRQAERDLVRFFALSVDLFCIAGMDGFFRRVNSNFTRVLGFPEQELISRPFLDFVHPDDRRKTLAEMDNLARGLPVAQFRNRYRDARGRYVWFEWTAKSIPEEGVIFAVARDVTDRVQFEQQIAGAI